MPTVKSDAADVALTPPLDVVTITFPVVVVAATPAEIWLVLFTVKDVAATPPIVTEVTPVNWVPVMVIVVGTGLVDGETCVTVGGGAAVTIKVTGCVADPFGFVRETVKLVWPTSLSRGLPEK